MMYDALRQAIAGERLPLALVDLDALDQNIERIRERVRERGKTLRLATKSVRVPGLIEHIMNAGAPVFSGLMCYCVEEAVLLASLGHDDLLIAYPTVQQSDLAAASELTREGKRVTLMIDSTAQIEAIETFMEAKFAPGARISICIDADMSYRPLGGLLHLGVMRSPIRSIARFGTLLDRVRSSARVRLDGVMGYEAQIAGVTNANPFTPLLNPIKELIRRKSAPRVAAFRRAIREELRRSGDEIRFFNGGGTGSLASTTGDSSVTEVTAGSGFLQSHLFDYYRDSKNVPALMFVLQVVRMPEAGVVTCSGGGYIASGEIGSDKAPRPYLPDGLEPLGREGFGEVQTPLKNRSGIELRPGDPVFMRPAKAGEIAERFNEYVLLRGGKIVGREKTYRGHGNCFP